MQNRVIHMHVMQEQTRSLLDYKCIYLREKINNIVDEDHKTKYTYLPATGYELIIDKSVDDNLKDNALIYSIAECYNRKKFVKYIISLNNLKFDIHIKSLNCIKVYRKYQIQHFVNRIMQDKTKSLVESSILKFVKTVIDKNEETVSHYYEITNDSCGVYLSTDEHLIRTICEVYNEINDEFLHYQICRKESTNYVEFENPYKNMIFYKRAK